jgi:hypothetical protein
MMVSPGFSPNKAIPGEPHLLKMFLGPSHKSLQIQSSSINLPNTQIRKKVGGSERLYLMGRRVLRGEQSPMGSLRFYTGGR